MVDVLGGVGEERQPAERPDQVQLLVDRPLGSASASESSGLRPSAAGVDGVPPHRLDEVEHLVTGLVADDVAEDAPEQPDVGAEGLVLAERSGLASHAGQGRAPSGNLSWCRDSNRSPPCATPRPANRSTCWSPRRTTSSHPTRWRVTPPEPAQHRPRRRADRWGRPLCRAAALLRQWIADGVLVARRRTVVHALPHALHRRRPATARDLAGVIGALEVVDEGAGGVLPHERTTPKASTDRLDLTRATRANLSPVWGLSLAAGLTGLLQRARRAGRRGDRRRRHPSRRAGHRPPSGSPRSSARRRATTSSSPTGTIATASPGSTATRSATPRTYRRRVDAAELTLAFVGELVAEQLSVEAIHRLYAGRRRRADLAALGSLLRPDPDRPADSGHAGGDGGRRVPRPRRAGRGAPADAEARSVRRRARPRRRVAGTGPRRLARRGDLPARPRRDRSPRSTGRRRRRPS